jgi:archaellum component FlaC
MSLDFGYTCPSIDKCIGHSKSIIEEHITEIVKEYNPIINGLSNYPPEIQNEIKGHVDCLFEEIGSLFEELRGLNEDMRKQADHQIEFLERQVEDLEYELKEYSDAD